jgi:rhamnosyltransferase
MGQRTSAIVVTYHPRSEHVANLAKVRAQVDVLIVVDNGSAESALGEMRRRSVRDEFTLIENGANVGIATALNIGVREAQREGCDWVVLLDQDSVPTDGFVGTMIADFEAMRRERPILQIIPRYCDPETRMERPVSQFGDGGAFLTITSGSVFSMDAFEKCGLFQEELFIYCVDDDYSLRIREKGYYIGVSPNAVLMHQSGHPTSRKVLGKTVSTKNYRPEVRYYYARNKVWILKNYGRVFPRLIAPTLREFVTTPVKIAMMEDSPSRKIWMFVRGIFDGVAGKMGPLRDRSKPARRQDAIAHPTGIGTGD